MARGVDTQRCTKIVATLGPASAAKSVLRDMISAGMDVARVNFSHGSSDSNLALFAAVRAAAKEAGRPVGLLQDLQGSRLRIGVLPPEGFNLIDGAMVFLRTGVESAEPGVIPVPEGRLSKELKRGDVLLLDDGRLELEIFKIEGRRMLAKVLVGGVLYSYRGITIPTVVLSTESFTEHDLNDLVLGLKLGVDFVALSCVRSGQDVRSLRKVIERRLPEDFPLPAVMATIEKREALEHFQEILEEADGIIIARGDLGLATAASSVPLYQKELIAHCIVAGKPVMVSTHMLSSMQYRPRPTQAEVSDMANAVIDHTDALVLSGETAIGRHPVQTVAVAAQTIRATEESPLDNLLPHREVSGESVSFAVGAAAVELARHVNAAAILVTTHSGYSARAVVRFRPERPLFATTDDPRVQRQLNVSWGVTPLYVEGYAQPERMVEGALKEMRGKYQVRKGPVVVVSGLKRTRGRYDSMIKVVEP